MKINIRLLLIFFIICLISPLNINAQKLDKTKTTNSEIKINMEQIFPSYLKISWKKFDNKDIFVHYIILKSKDKINLKYSNRDKKNIDKIIIKDLEKNEYLESHKYINKVDPYAGNYWYKLCVVTKKEKVNCSKVENTFYLDVYEMYDINIDGISKKNSLKIDRILKNFREKVEQRFKYSGISYYKIDGIKSHNIRQIYGRVIERIEKKEKENLNKNEKIILNCIKYSIYEFISELDSDLMDALIYDDLN